MAELGGLDLSASPEDPNLLARAPDALPALRDLLALRQFFRHAYSVPLDVARLCTLRRRAQEVLPLLLADFARLDAWLATLASRT